MMSFIIGMLVRCFSQIDDSYQGNVHFNPVQFPLAQVKPIAAQWIMDSHHCISTHPEFIQNGFRAAGITGAINELSSLMKQLI